MTELKTGGKLLLIKPSFNFFMSIPPHIYFWSLLKYKLILKKLFWIKIASLLFWKCHSTEFWIFQKNLHPLFAKHFSNYLKGQNYFLNLPWIYEQDKLPKTAQTVCPKISDWLLLPLNFQVGYDSTHSEERLYHNFKIICISYQSLPWKCLVNSFYEKQPLSTAPIPC